MKRLLLMFGALMLMTLPIAQAQEDEEAEETEKLGLRATDPTTRSEPTVTVPSESSSSGNYPRPGQPLVTPSPTPAATPRATATPTRAASPKKAASPTPAATATPAATKGNIAATIKELENRWAAAIASHDVSVPQALVANDYIGVDSTGTVVNKNALIAGMRRDKNTYDSAVNSAMTVRVHGNAAVIVGTTKQAGKDPQGKQFNYTYRWTDTWVERNGQWQCVASQSFLVGR